MIRDYDVGGRTGSGEHNAQLEKQYRNARVSQLKLQETNLNEDQHLFRNQYGLLECKLCCTHHRTEASYIAHTYGKTHKRNLERRKVVQARKEAMIGGVRTSAQPLKESTVSTLPKIGDPTYSVYKSVDRTTGNMTILFEITYESIRKHTSPKYRIMSSYEQKIEQPDSRYQYILFAAQPYNTIAVKIPNFPILDNKTIEDWKPSEKIYTVQITVAK